MLLVKMMLLGFKQKIKLNHTIVIVMTILMETLSKFIFNFALKKQLTQLILCLKYIILNNECDFYVYSISNMVVMNNSHHL